MPRDENVIRVCGECTLCCKLIGVSELKKEPNTWCEHCDIGVGCKIYDERPETCREFKCVWLVEKRIPETDRPDHVGLVMFATADSKSLQVHVDPHRPDAYLKGKSGQLLQVISNSLPVLITIGDKRKVMGAPDVLAKLAKQIKDKQIEKEEEL